MFNVATQVTNCDTGKCCNHTTNGTICLMYHFSNFSRIYQMPHAAKLILLKLRLNDFMVVNAFPTDTEKQIESS